MARTTLGPVVATVLVAAAGILAAPTPAGAAASAAAACRGATGVTVVVDYNELGGPTRAGCAPDGGGESAAQAFRDAGFSLEYHPQQHGYVCKVSGLPSSGECLENDAFWSLWWSDGKSGRWVFSNQSVGGLSVADGGYVAFAWHQGAGSAQPPDVVPTPHEAPDPTDDDGDNDGGNDGNGDGNDGRNDGDGGGGGGRDGDDDQSSVVPPTTTTSSPTSEATSTASGSESAKADRPKKRRDRGTPSESATSSSGLPAAAEITDGPPPGDLAAETGDDDSALATWIGLGVAVLVLGAAGLVTVLRRRAG